MRLRRDLRQQLEVEAEPDGMDFRMLCQETVLVTASAPETVSVGIEGHSRYYNQVKITAIRMVLRFGNMEITFRKRHVFSQFHRDDIVTDHGRKDEGLAQVPFLQEGLGLNLVRESTIEHHSIGSDEIGMLFKLSQDHFGLFQKLLLGVLLF